MIECACQSAPSWAVLDLIASVNVHVRCWDDSERARWGPSIHELAPFVFREAHGRYNQSYARSRHSPCKNVEPLDTRCD